MAATETYDAPALVDLGNALRGTGYRFVTITPESHRRVIARAEIARDVRDVFGWSRPFSPSLLSKEIGQALARSRAFHLRPDGLLQSEVRFSSLDNGLYAHSAYPTVGADAVFFGPDTYRYCAFLRRILTRIGRVVDVGCGSGAGGLVLAERAREVVLGDINAGALLFSRVNAELAGASTTIVHSDVLAGIEGPIDAVISNPPYLVDAAARAYRDGGDGLGTGLALRIVRESLARLSPGGRLLLYTGAPVVAGKDVFRAHVLPILAARGASFEYDELDVDVFGEELSLPAYRDVERIAVVTLVATV